MKKKVVLVLGIVLVLCLGIGGKFYMDKEKEKKLIEIERESIILLKDTFSDVEKVEVKNIGYNNTTGSYHILVKMTNTSGESVNFSYGFWKERKELGSYVLKNENIQKKGKTLNKITVIYSNGEKEKL